MLVPRISAHCANAQDFASRCDPPAGRARCSCADPVRGRPMQGLYALRRLAFRVGRRLGFCRWRAPHRSRRAAPSPPLGVETTRGRSRTGSGCVFVAFVCVCVCDPEMIGCVCALALLCSYVCTHCVCPAAWMLDRCIPPHVAYPGSPIDLCWRMSVVGEILAFRAHSAYHVAWLCATTHL